MSNNDGMQNPTTASFDSWCRTKGGEEVNYSFCWTIEKFSQRPEENGQVINVKIYKNLIVYF